MNSAHGWDSAKNNFPKVKMNRYSSLRKTGPIEFWILSVSMQAEYRCEWRGHPQVQAEGLIPENTEWTCSEMDPWQPEPLVPCGIVLHLLYSLESRCVWLTSKSESACGGHRRQMVGSLQDFPELPLHVTLEPHVTLDSVQNHQSPSPHLTPCLEDALLCENMLDVHCKILQSPDSFLIINHYDTKIHGWFYPDNFAGQTWKQGTKLQRATQYCEVIPHFSVFFPPLWRALACLYHPDSEYPRTERSHWVVKDDLILFQTSTGL